jgi:Glycerophosphoryl diester phosphodiesterase family
VFTGLCAGEAPENTAAACMQANAAGADALLIDVLLSKDGVVAMPCMVSTLNHNIQYLMTL